MNGGICGILIRINVILNGTSTDDIAQWRAHTGNNVHFLYYVILFEV